MQCSSARKHKNKTMNLDINKDLLIDVLTKENSNLKKITELQQMQIEQYMEHVESYKDYVNTCEKQFESMRALIDSYVEQVHTLGEAIIIRDQCIDELAKE
jgi:chorismate synthase